MRPYTVVLPTVGRPSLPAVLTDLHTSGGPHPQEVIVVDDRPLEESEPLALAEHAPAVRVVRSGGRGPAAARNAGWRSATTEWVVFLDDDVRLPGRWTADLAADLRAAGPGVAGVQGRISVPLPPHRRPTDWERNTAGLQSARWATADMAYRRAALAQVHGFDERFPRAYREDADLALRVRRAGWRLCRGRRRILHPARPAPADVSLRMQAGASSDALMRALHGRYWRTDANIGRGRFPWHTLTVLSALAALGSVVARRRAPALAWALMWAGLTADFTARRLRPGPRPGEAGWAREWCTMAATSVLIPWLAVYHRARGTAGFRHAEPWPPPVRAVLLDRDGTLIHDVPYNGDPDRVRPVPGAREAADRLRGMGLAVGMVTNQAGLARGLITTSQVARVNARVADLVGPFDVVEHCPHGPRQGCTCRKPAPGLVLAAAARMGVAPHECVLIGDIGSDVDAARGAGAHSILVPTPLTRAAEVAGAERLAPDLTAAVAQVEELAGARVAESAGSRR